RIYRVCAPETPHSPLVAEVQQLVAEGFDQRSTAELTRLLAHADQRVRQESQFALATRGAAGLEAFLAALRTNHELARLHAVWGLGQIANRKSKIASSA